MQKIVILTGAGISAESGLGTFRDAGGLWAQHRIEDVATPEGFARNPTLVHDFYNARRQQSRTAKPNAAHRAIAKLQTRYTGEVILVTQNVDALHEAAGSPQVIHMHGALGGALCASCAHRWRAPDTMTLVTPCPACHANTARPDIVWFGEMPYHMDAIYTHLEACTLFVSIGTSGNVYPAAGFVQIAHAAGADTLELNLEPSATATDFALSKHGKATQIVLEWADALLA